MSKRDKYQYAIRALEDALLDLEARDFYHSTGGPFKNIPSRRRKQLCDAIVVLGGDNPDDPGDSGGGPGDGP